MTDATLFILGLTGSIGMGKSTAAGFFKDLGVPVWDADAAVHRLYRKGGAAVALLGHLVPAAIKSGAVDRSSLKKWIDDTDDGLIQLEQIVHPLVATDRAHFLDAARQNGDKIAVLDIPLLFETSADARCDATLVMTALPAVQCARVMQRPGMTKRQFEQIKTRQMPDAEKRKRADFVIVSDTLNQTQTAVRDLLAKLKIRIADNA